MSGFGIYVHWPFCAAKCPYCDFNSHVREQYDDARWAEAIASELAFAASLTGKTQDVGSVFFGGGTPSLMGGKAAARVLDAIAGLWTMAPDAEITLEANPNSVEQSRFRDYRAAGVNRVSIGVQALDGDALKALGRLHGVDEAVAAVKLAAAIFPRVGFDLIYARPGQSLAAWESELRRALDFGTEHVSLYQLTIEPGTAFASLARQGKMKLPDEDLAADFYELTQEMCARAGLPAYEVSNHARSGAESRHNLVYWRYGDYVGVGPGAHGRLTLAGKRVATEAERLPEHWFAAVARAGNSLKQNEIAPDDAAHEHLLMGLRLSEGIDLRSYRQRWGTEPDKIGVARLADAGLVWSKDNRLGATPSGRLVLNRVITALSGD